MDAFLFVMIQYPMTKTILITGANRGIGLELSKQYHNAGWQVIAASRKPSDALESLGVETVTLDVTDANAITALAKSLEGRAIDVLFNNAGIFGPRRVPVGELEAEVWLEVLKVNTVAPAIVAQAFVENVAASQDKIMVFMSSSMASIEASSPGEYIYRSSKAALNMVVARLAQDLAPKSIRTVAMDPGWVQTDMGGAAADLTPEQSASGIKSVLDNLSSESSGVYLRYDGSSLPW